MQNYVIHNKNVPRWVSIYPQVASILAKQRFQAI